MNSKKVSEWLSQLPDPYREQALCNVFLLGNGNGDEVVESIEKALTGSFLWANSPQGGEYWSKLLDMIISEEYRHNNPQ